jgi:hypothetical protein
VISSNIPVARLNNKTYFPGDYLAIEYDVYGLQQHASIRSLKGTVRLDYVSTASFGLGLKYSYFNIKGETVTGEVNFASFSFMAKKGTYSSDAVAVVYGKEELGVVDIEAAVLDENDRFKFNTNDYLVRPYWGNSLYAVLIQYGDQTQYKFWSVKASRPEVGSLASVANMSSSGKMILQVTSSTPLNVTYLITSANGATYNVTAVYSSAEAKDPDSYLIN